MSKPVPLEDLARRWAAAKDEVTRLKRERNALLCVKEQADPAAIPCWKLTRFDPDDCDMPGPVTWEHETEPADWCPFCVARQALHVQISPAIRRAASLQGALLRAARRSVTG